jgi:hypothetical protein
LSDREGTASRRALLAQSTARGQADWKRDKTDDEKRPPVPS